MDDIKEAIQSLKEDRRRLDFLEASKARVVHTVEGNVGVWSDGLITSAPTLREAIDKHREEVG